MFSLFGLKKELVTAVNKYLPAEAGISPDILEYPPDPKMGDVALPCFILAGKLRRAPQQIAEFLKEKLVDFVAKNRFIKEIKVAGPYLNFVLDKELIARKILTKKPKNQKNKKQKIIIEYVSPNSNKPLHLGHIRNGLIGESVSNILKAQGAKVIRTSLVNDRGIHIAKSMLAYLKFGGGETPQKTKEKGDVFVGRYYLLYGEKLKENPSLENEAYELLKRWEGGDKETVALWKKMTRWALGGFEETYKKLGIKFNKTYFESKIYKHGKKLVEEAWKNKIFEKDKKGNIVANLEKYDLPNKIVLRADGTSIYATNDISLAYERVKDFSFDKLLYVVASEQDLYFKQLLKIFELLKAPFAKKLFHLSYGLVLLPEGKLKSREGTRVDADDLIKKMEEMVKKEIIKRHPEFSQSATSSRHGGKCADPLTKMSGKELKVRAEILALAALKYYILQIDPKSDMLFKPKESILLTGRTGVYLEYSFARIQSILKKFQIPNPKFQTTPTFSPYFAAGETGGVRGGENPKIKSGLSAEKKSASSEELVMQIIKFEEAVKTAAEQLNPAHLANYLFELAQKLNDFYEKTPVLKAPEPARTERLALIKIVANVLKEGMEMLGIKTVNEV
jgi:arginyl-tRNA synthetase